jgi:DNA-binding NtrC family response regulator
MPLSFGPLSVLVVDNDDIARTSVTCRMRKQGLRVAMTADAESAIDLLRSSSNPVDVVVTEAKFRSGPDGFFLANWVSTKHPGVAIALTSRTVRFAEADSLMPAGAAFIEKPYDVDALIPLLRELVDDLAA